MVVGWLSHYLFFYIINVSSLHNNSITLVGLVPPAEIWLDWLKDEIRLTEEEPNREKVYELFERAVKDYICECSALSLAVGWSLAVTLQRLPHILPS